MTIAINPAGNIVCIENNKSLPISCFLNKQQKDVFQCTFNRISDVIETNGTIIKREYLYNLSTNENSYKFSINKNENSLIDISRNFKNVTPNVTKTTINGDEYVCEYFDKTKTVTVHLPNGKTRIIDLGKKLNNNLPILKFLEPEIGINISNEKTELLWQNSKTLPADLLLDIDMYVENWNYCNDINSFAFVNKNFLATGCEISFILHEIGHFKGVKSGLVNDDELIEFYKKELDLFNQKHKSEKVRDEISYYTGKFGLDELIADTNVLTTTFGYKDERVQERLDRLTANFPMTISYILNMLKS